MINQSGEGEEWRENADVDVALHSWPIPSRINATEQAQEEKEKNDRRASGKKERSDRFDADTAKSTVQRVQNGD